MMWECPIQMIAEDITKDMMQKQDELLMESVHRIGFNIDKDELLKALNYDRNQYRKGYADGRLERDSEINLARWIPVEERNPEIDMSYPHSECYLVTYEDGALDVARWSNVNPFWTDHVTEPRWWGQQFCKVVAWMPLPEPWKGEGCQT